MLLAQPFELVFHLLQPRLNESPGDLFRTPQVPGQWEATLLKQRIAETVGDR